MVTGLDISMQKEGSFLLSHKGLKYYFERDKKTFDEVKTQISFDEVAKRRYRYPDKRDCSQH